MICCMGYHHNKIKVIRINSQFIQLSQLYKTIPNINNDLLDCWEAHIRLRKAPASPWMGQGWNIPMLENINVG